MKVIADAGRKIGNALGNVLKVPPLDRGQKVEA